MEIIDKILDFVQNQLPLASTIVAVALEFLFRLIKTDKPIGIIRQVILPAAKVLKAILDKIGLILVALIEFLDKVIPQRTNPPQQ